MITFFTYLGNIAFGVFLHCALIQNIAENNALWTAFYAVMCVALWLFAFAWVAQKYRWL